MTQREPTAAQALYGHLRSSARELKAGPKPTLSEAMYPRPKPPNPYRESLLRHLKEFNAKGKR